MTIAEDILLNLRTEYPDLDAEVRSILLSRAKDGATISDIKKDYYDRLGDSFPVYDNIIEYMLSIPNVSAMCSPAGTLIFNMIPTEKTKHLYELVINQKDTHKNSYVRRTNTKYYHQEQRVPKSSFLTNYDNINYGSQVTLNEPMQDYNHYNNNNNNIKNNNNDNFIENFTNNKQDFVVNDEAMDIDINENELSSFYYQDNVQHLFGRLQNCNNTNRSPQAYKNNQRLSDNPFNFPTKIKCSQFKKKNVQKYSPNIPAGGMFKRPMRQSIGSATTLTRSSGYNGSMFFSDENHEANLFGIPILADDFFMFMARMELHCKYIKHDGVLISGLSMSGQSIGAACKNLERLPASDMSIIINVGSVDIMQGKSLLQMEHDFRKLLAEVTRKGFRPILTTLAPLANYSHNKEVKRQLERFNGFIKREGKSHLVVDVWTCLVNERGSTLFDCFQNAPRYVTGANESYLFWNKIGRQRVLQLLQSTVEY